MLLGLLSLVNRASLNQRAVGSTPTRPTKINNSQISSFADLHGVDAGFGLIGVYNAFNILAGVA